MTPLALLITAAIITLTVTDWRKGLLAVLLIGVLQDSLRKLTPEVPSYYILWAMVVYAFVVLVAFLNRSLPDYKILFLNDSKVRTSWLLFFVLVSLQLVNALLRYGGPAVPIFGAIFYLGPPIAMLVGVAFLDRGWRIKQFIVAYVLIFVPVCLTVYLSKDFEDSWPVLREIGSFVGRELIIYDVGTILQSYSGLFRSGEIASWHAATAAMFLATLALNSPSTARRLACSLLIVSLIGVIILTGRRKMLMTLSIFFVFQWVLLARFRHGMGKLSVILIAVGTLASYSFTLLEPASESSLYVQRSSSVFGDATTRFSTSVILMKSAFNRSSGVGLGAGAGSQGTQYAGVDASKTVGGSAESGLGKLMVELGVPGILTAIMLLVLVGRRILKDMNRVEMLGDRYLIYQISFVSIMFANLITFTVATQIYGDLFILIILGTVGGFMVQINEKVRQYVIFHSRSRRKDKSIITDQATAGRATAEAARRRTNT